MLDCQTDMMSLMGVSLPDDPDDQEDSPGQ
jgi:hypothetical protein